MQADSFPESKVFEGKSERQHDEIRPFPARALAAALSLKARRFSRGSDLPPLWHWLYFLPTFPSEDTGSDGHRNCGGLLPSQEGYRRMWAGGALTYQRPFQIGQSVRKTSTVRSVERKVGRAGVFILCKIEHVYRTANEDVLYEVQNVAFVPKVTERQPPEPPTSPIFDSDHSETVFCDPVMLFRYSALTYNSHRIHYDRQYTVEEEGYDDLVVQGPLQATLLAELTNRVAPENRIRTFKYRAVMPLTVDQSCTVHVSKGSNSNALDYWVTNSGGIVTMRATGTVFGDDDE